jgi:outer membrane receptor protein involved in Fe transport
MVRDGAPPSSRARHCERGRLMYNAFGATFNFLFSIGIVEGNPNLASEEAETMTFGMVLSFDKATFSADLFDIDITQAIGTPAFQAIYRQCMDAAYNPLVGSAPGTYTGAQLAAGNPFCALINREYVGATPQQGATGAARTFDARYMNQGGIAAKGLDLQLDLRFDVGGAALNTNFQATILDEYSETAFPGAIPVEYTGTLFNSSYDYRLFTTVRYQQSSWGLGLRWQYLPTIEPTGSTAGAQGVDAHSQFDLFADWTFSERYTPRAGIDNLTDAEPEVVGATTTNNARQHERQLRSGSTPVLRGLVDGVLERFGRRATPHVARRSDRCAWRAARTDAPERAGRAERAPRRRASADRPARCRTSSYAARARRSRRAGYRPRARCRRA